MAEYDSWVPKEKPWLPPDYDDRVVYAVRALSQGNANQGQQAIIMRWIRYITEFEGSAFRPGGADGDRDTNFALGKQFVGQQFFKMLHPELKLSDELKAAKEAAQQQSPKRMR